MLFKMEVMEQTNEKIISVLIFYINKQKVMFTQMFTMS